MSKGRTVGPEGLQGTCTRLIRKTENCTGVTLLGAPEGYADYTDTGNHIDLWGSKILGHGRDIT